MGVDLASAAFAAQREESVSPSVILMLRWKQHDSG